MFRFYFINNYYFFINIMILDFFKFGFGFGFGPILIILGIFLILFLIGREIFLWYFRVNIFYILNGINLFFFR